MTETKTIQRVATQDRDNLALVPPLAEEFAAYGDKGAVERAREWALGNRYLLATGIPACAHGLYLLARCPNVTCTNVAKQLDHAQVWVPEPGPYSSRPFILSHCYADRISDQTRAYAAAHGLTVESYPFDGWYECGTLPIRMAIPHTVNWPWPIEVTSGSLLTSWPVRWPAEDDHQ